jgi:hypothetical protein
LPASPQLGLRAWLDRVKLAGAVRMTVDVDPMSFFWSGTCLTEGCKFADKRSRGAAEARRKFHHGDTEDTEKKNGARTRAKAFSASPL